MTNRLYYGDNLEVLRAQVADESVDLIYLDPPFNSNASYNILFRSTGGTAADSQIEAFDDSWHWGASAEAAYDDVMKSHHTDVGELLRTMRSFLRDNDMMAYLAMMAVRLIELHRVLKPTGSLYLHCDPTASHYLKLLLDGVFGSSNFRNEIIWLRHSARSVNQAIWPRLHDVVLHYAKDGVPVFHTTTVPSGKASEPHDLVRWADGKMYRTRDLTGAGTRNGETGQPWRNVDVTLKNRHWRVMHAALDALAAADRIHWQSSGMPRARDELPYVSSERTAVVGDVWIDVPAINAGAQERLGYPTQKPLALLERIISASSNPGDVVLDPFCGCGTALEAAQTLGRQWIGIDVTHLAIHLIEKRLHKKFGEDAKFTTEGRPKDLASAEELAKRDKHEFQKWITTFIDGVPWRGGRKGADGGIDGLINFDGYDRDADKPVSTKAIISVKGGANKGVGFVSELVETIARENAAVGVLVMAALPTREMEKRAAAAGFYDLGPYGRFARIQILTLAEIIQQGKRPHLPNIDRKPVGKAVAKSADPRSPKML